MRDAETSVVDFHRHKVHALLVGYVSMTPHPQSDGYSKCNVDGTNSLDRFRAHQGKVNRGWLTTTWEGTTDDLSHPTRMPSSGHAGERQSRSAYCRLINPQDSKLRVDQPVSLPMGIRTGWYGGRLCNIRDERGAQRDTQAFLEEADRPALSPPRACVSLRRVDSGRNVCFFYGGGDLG